MYSFTCFSVAGWYQHLKLVCCPILSCWELCVNVVFSVNKSLIVSWVNGIFSAIDHCGIVSGIWWQLAKNTYRLGKRVFWQDTFKPKARKKVSVLGSYSTQHLFLVLTLDEHCDSQIACMCDIAHLNKNLNVPKVFSMSDQRSWRCLLWWVLVS